MDTTYTHWKPEVWCGIECTLNRVGDVYKDQLELSKHYERAADLAEIAGLGVKRIRYPVLWEKHQPGDHAEPDFSWATAQLEKLRNDGIMPIVGLVHHGSGPAHTSLLDPTFGDKLAQYASKVARAFPWVDAWTPVNEPLTTARFSGLYGHWYPHAREEASFLKMLVNQVRGTILAMKAIRAVNPEAMLVQTEDLCEVSCTPGLEYQAEFENHRRWLSYDLLCGLVNKDHVLWQHLISNGIDENTLQFFINHPCPPDVAGFNYYVTSERYLDQNLEKYSPILHGGNGRDVYVDTERVRNQNLSGLRALLKQAWDRYHLPLAITECHLHCTREEQMRWLWECWEACKALGAEGVPVRAITVWSALGAYDWNRLLTSKQNDYETGVFDIRGGRPRPTALAAMVKGMANENEYYHPVLDGRGWWQPESVINAQALPLLIIGARGTLGNAFVKICKRRGLHAVAVTREELDIRHVKDIEYVMEQHQPWAVVNATGYVKVDEAELNPAECFEINTCAAVRIARACAARGIPLLSFSTDLVFDGIAKKPYAEMDATRPLNVYGNSKAQAESQIMQVHEQSLIIRTSAFFGPWDRYNFAHDVVNTLNSGGIFSAPDDVIISPTYVPDLVDTSLDLLIDGETGIWHISNHGSLSWSAFAGAVARGAGLDEGRINPCTLSSLDLRALRPRFSALESSRGIKLPTLENALERYFLEEQNFN